MLRSSTFLAPRCASRALRAAPFRSGVAFPFRARVRHTVSASQQEQQQQEKLNVPSSPPPPGNNNNNKDKDQQQDTKLETVVLELKKAGMDTARARKLLAAWTKIGVNDPEQLRKLLIQRSMQPLTNTLLQCLVDGIASFGGFYLAYLASNSGDMPFRFVVELLGDFCGLYYFTNVLLQLSIAGGIVYSTYRYGTSSVELLAAVQQLAGPQTGLSIVDKAQAVVNTFKVLQTLQTVALLLQEQYGNVETSSTGSARDSLRNLTALLTLARAKEELGFTPEQYGLSEKQAANVALAFSVYDTNDNGKLETQEVGNLCASLGWTLEDAELKEAVKTLDRDQNGSIDFKEFVEWYCMKSPKSAQQEA